EVFAAVGALVKTTFTTTADDRPRFALEMRHPRVNHIRIAWLQLDIHRADRVRDKQYFAPRLAAVRRFENAALVVRLEDVAIRCDPRDVGICWMNAHCADLSGVVETHKLPRLAGVS